jgi:hypothetical protein
LSSLNISGLTILNNVGIGIDNPNTKCEISGIDAFRVSDYRELGQPSIEFVKGAAERTDRVFGSSFDTDWRIKSNDYGEFAFYAKALNRPVGFQIDGVMAKISNNGKLTCNSVDASALLVGKHDGGYKITAGENSLGSVINLAYDGKITCQSLNVVGKIDGYVASRVPIYFITSRNVTINGKVHSAYDLDLNKYTKFLTLDGRKFRQFRLRSWHASGNFETLDEMALTYSIYMSDLNGLSIKAYAGPYVNFALDQVNTVTPTFYRNTFDIITYLSPVDIFGNNVKVYCIFEDLL